MSNPFSLENLAPTWVEATEILKAGDVEGHAFHGNQYSQGVGGGGSSAPRQVDTGRWGQVSGGGVPQRTNVGGNPDNFPKPEEGQMVSAGQFHQTPEQQEAERRNQAISAYIDTHGYAPDQAPHTSWSGGPKADFETGHMHGTGIGASPRLGTIPSPRPPVPSKTEGSEFYHATPGIDPSKYYDKK